jgi:hypothetical protein
MEIITFNAARIQTFPHQRWAADIREQWTNAHVTSSDDGEPILTPNFWAMLYWRDNHPVVFRTVGRYDASKRGDLTVAFNGVLKLCEEGSVTGDVVLYRSTCNRFHAAEKYPLSNNGTYAIFTGMPAWVLSANPTWREPEEDGWMYDPDYDKFQSQFPAFQKLQPPPTREFNPLLGRARRHSRHLQNLASQAEQLNLRIAYVWGMLTVNERNGLFEQSQWESIMETFPDSQRAALLLWKEGKVRMWWNWAAGMPNVSHWMGVTPGASDLEGAGLRIDDDSGRFVEAND